MSSLGVGRSLRAPRSEWGTCPMHGRREGRSPCVPSQVGPWQEHLRTWAGLPTEVGEEERESPRETVARRERERARERREQDRVRTPS